MSATFCEDGAVCTVEGASVRESLAVPWPPTAPLWTGSHQSLDLWITVHREVRLTEGVAECD